ncbi:MAG: DMT family transporter, partial [Acidobacteriaceae bacterium]
KRMPSAQPPRISRNTVAHLLMFAMVIIWGTMFVMVKEALAYMGPQWFNALRMTVAFVCVALVYYRQWSQLTRTAWLAGATAGAAMAAGFFFQTEGLRATTATNSAFLTALVVVFVPFLVSLPGLRSPGAPLPQWPAWTGALIAFLGVALLTTPGHTPWLQLLHSLNRGDIFSIACALGFALQIIALDHGAKRVRFDQLTLLQIGFAMLFLIVAAIITEPPAAGAWAHLRTHLFSAASPLHRPSVLFAIAAAGILATALAFSVQTWAQQVIPPTNLAVIVTLEPVFAWLTAFLVLGESLHLRRALGALLVLTGVLAAELLPRWRARLQGGEQPRSQ